MKWQSKPHEDFTLVLLEWLTSIIQIITNAGEDTGKKELSYAVSGNVNQYNHYEKQYGGSSEIELPSDTAIRRE
jgi:hypothetical protein